MQEALKKVVSDTAEPIAKTVALCIRSQKIELNGVWKWDMNSAAVYCSDVMSFPDEFIGTKGIVHPDDLPKLIAALSLMEEKEISRLDFRLITTYGEVKDISGQRVSIEVPKTADAMDIIPGKEPWEEALQQLSLQKEADFSYLRREIADYTERFNNVGSWLINKSNAEAWYSDNVYRIYGLGPQSLNAHSNSFNPFIHPEDRVAVLDAFEKAYEEEVSLHIEYRIVLPDGESRYVQQITKWIYSAKGQLVFAGILRDVSEERKMADELFAAQSATLLNQQLLKLSEQKSATGHWHINLITRKASFSDNYYRIYGVKQNALPLYNSFLSLIHPEDRNKVRDVIDQMYHEHALPEMEFRIIRPDGKMRTLRQTGRSFIASNKEMIMIGIVQDVTVLKSLENKIAGLNTVISLNHMMTEMIEAGTGISSITWLPDGYMRWSNGFYQLLGYRPGSMEPIPRLLHKSIHPKDLMLFKQAEALLVNGQPHDDILVRIVSKKGMRLIKFSFRQFSDEKEGSIAIGLAGDVTMQKALQEELSNSKSFGELVLNSVNDIIIFTNTDNVVLSWNGEAEKSTGISREDALRNNLFDVLPKLNEEDFLGQLHFALRGNETQSRRVANAYIRKMHDYWLFPLKNEEGEVLGVLHVVQDVSEQLMLQQQLSERLNFIESLVESSVDRIVVLDRFMNYLYWNKKAEDYYGISKEKVLGKNILEVFPAFRNHIGYNEFRKVLKGETVHLPASSHEESQEYAETYLVPIKDEAGEVTAVLWIVHDLSKEFHLREEQRKTYRILDAIETACYELNREGSITYANRKAEEFLGKSKEEMMGKNIWDIIPESKESKCWPAIQLSALDKKQFAQFEYISSVSKTWISLSAMPTEEGCIVLFNEIQDIIEARIELEKQQETVRQMLNGSMAAIVFLQSVRDEEGKIIDFIYKGVNNSAERITNYTAEQLLDHSYLQLSPKAKDVFFDAYAEVVETGKMLHAEKHYPHEQFGKDTWFEVTAAKNGDGLILTFLDITGRKKTEQEILRLKDEVAQKATDKYLRLFNSIDEGFCIIEVLFDESGTAYDYRFLEANTAFEKQSGLLNAVGKTMKELAPANEQYWFDIYGRIAKTGKPERFENEAKALGFYYEVYAFGIDAPKEHHVAVLFNDITNRKNAEIKIQENEKRFRNVLLQSPNIFAILQGFPEMIITFANESLFKSWGRSAEIIGKPLLEALPEIKDQRFPKQLQKVFETGETYSSSEEKAVIIKNGIPVDTYYVYVYQPIFDDNQKVTGVTIMATDITEQVIARKKIEKSEEKYRSLFESIDEGVSTLEIIFDGNDKAVDFRFLESNPAMTKMTGLTPEIHGKTAKEVLPNIQDFWLETYERVVKTGEPNRFEYNLEDLNYNWFDVYVSRVGGEGSRKVICVYSNITERKQREAQQQYLLKIGDAIRSIENPVAIEEAVTKIALDHFAADRCYYTTIKEENAIVKRDARRGDLPSVSGTYPVNAFAMLKTVYDTGKPYIVDDVRIEDTPDKEFKEIAIQLNIISFISMPVVKEGNTLGILNLVQAEARHWTNADVQLIAETAERIWAAVERANAEEALKKSEEKYHSLFDTMEEGLVTCGIIRNDEGEIIDFKYIEVNSAFEQQTGADRHAFLGLTFTKIFSEAEAGRWIRTYKNIIDKGGPVAFEDYSENLNRWFLISVYQSSAGEMSVFFRDITERKRTGANLAFLAEVSQDLVHLTNVDETINLLTAKIGHYFNVKQCVFAEHTNELKTAVATLGWHAEDAPDMRGTYPLKDFLSEEVMAKFLRGEPLVVTDTQTDPLVNAANYASLGILSFIAVPLIRNGEWCFQINITCNKRREWRKDEIELLSELTTRIWTKLEKAKAEEALRQSEEKYRTIFTNIDEGFVISELLYDENGKAYDLRVMETNQRFNEMMQVTDAIGKTAKEIFPNAEDSWFEMYNEVVTAGKAVRFENYLKELERWFELYISRIGGEGSRLFAIVFNDITESKDRNKVLKNLVEQRTSQLKESKELLQGIINAPNVGLAVYKAVRDKKGKIIDFVHEFINKRTIAALGKDMTGKLLSDHGKDGSDQLPKFIEAIETREPNNYIKHSQFGGKEHWVLFSNAPLDEERMVHVWEDITEHKKAEQELQKQLTLLKYTEYLAQSGTWDYEIGTKKFTWSEGMYKLFGLSQQKKVSPEIYLRHAIEQDRPIAEKIVAFIQTKHDPFEEVVRIKRQGEVRSIKVKGSVITDEKRKAQKVIGVDVDVTNIQKAEDQLKESRHWLEQTAKASPDSITIYDVEKKQPVYLNNCLAEWLGMSSNDLLEMGFEERLKLIDPGDRLDLLQNNEKTVTAKDNITIGMEYRLKTNGGKTIWVRNRSKPFQRDDSGKVTHILSILQNVTEEVELREQLKQRTQYAESIIDASIDRIAVYDKELRVIAWNRRAEELTGTKRQNVLGQKLFDVFPKVEQDEELLKAHLDALKGLYVSLPAKRGIYTNNYYERFFIPLKNERKETYAIVSVMHDVSDLVNRNAELNELNQSLEQKNEELEQKNEEITSFAFVASHDMKEPLRKIHTFSDWLVEQEAEQLSEKGKSMLEKMNTSVHRMEVLIDDILVLTKIHSDTRKEEEVNLNKILRQVFDNMFEQILLTQTGVHADELPIIKGNSNQIFYLFHNLISNAIKFQKPGNIPQIKITAEIIAGEETGISNPYDEYAKVLFADNGFGFDQRYAKKIFQVFQRLHGRHEFEGTGIGLAICKKIMENHEGMITVESEQGKGSVFSCYFPLF